MTTDNALQKQRMVQTIVYFIIVISFAMVMSAIGPVLPDIAAQVDTSPGRIGEIFAIRAVGALIGSLLGGWLFDRYPGHPVMGTCMILMAGSFVLVPFISSFVLLMVDGLVMGIVSSVLLVGANTLLVWVRSENVGPWMSALSFFNGLGGFFIPMIIVAFIRATGVFSGAFVLVAVFLAVAGIWFFFVTSPVIRKTENQDGSQVRIPWRRVLVFALIFLLYGGAEISFSSWLFTFVIGLHPGIEATATLLNSAFWLAMAVGRLLAIPIAARLRPVRILWIDFLGGLVSLAILLFLPRFIPALWVGTIGVGLCMASLFPVLLDFIDRRIKVNGKINGLFLSGVSIGAIFFPWLAGVMFDSRGSQATMAVIFAAYLIAAGIFGALTRVRTAQTAE
jgi:MFS transporter, FHS family, Na+ dependent glucose transporter 1